MRDCCSESPRRQSRCDDGALQEIIDVKSYRKAIFEIWGNEIFRNREFRLASVKIQIFPIIKLLYIIELRPAL
jgi:hypothetical protein